jgi:hypothetical protein
MAVAPEPRPITETVEKSLSIADSMSISDSTTLQGSFIRSSRIGGVQLNIDVTVQCTPADLDELGHKLRKLLKDFNEPEPKPEAEPAITPPTPPAAPPNKAAEE